MFGYLLMFDENKFKYSFVSKIYGKMNINVNNLKRFVCLCQPETD